MRGYFVLIAAVIMQICLGSIYGWSVFVQPLVNIYMFSVTQTQLIFGSTIAIFTITMMLSGRLYNTYGPRIIASIGGILFGLGYIIASASSGSFIYVMLGISLVSGMGIGFGYICPLSVSVLWFPKYKGLVSGLAVGGFGAGAIIVTSVASHYLAEGVDVLVLFRGLGVIYGLAILLVAQFLVIPLSACGSKTAVKSRTIKLNTLVADRVFTRLAMGMFSGTFAGLLVIGNLGSIGLAVGLSAREVVLGVSAFAVGNGLGRISWGWLYDMVGRITLVISLFVLALAILSLSVLSDFGILFILVAGLIGFSFGASFVLYVAYTATKYGATGVSQVYPAIFLFYGISGIFGPVMGGYLFDTTGSYQLAIIVATVVATLGAVGLYGIIKNQAE